MKSLRRYVGESIKYSFLKVFDYMLIFVCDGRHGKLRPRRNKRIFLGYKGVKDRLGCTCTTRRTVTSRHVTIDERSCEASIY